MKKLLFTLLTITTLILSACKDNDKKTVYLPSISGAAYEVLLVIDDSLYRTPAGEAMYYVLNAPTPILPQPEPMFKMSKVAPAHLQGLMQGCWLGATAVGNAALVLGAVMYETISLATTWSVFAIVCFISMGLMLCMVKWLERVAK